MNVTEALTTRRTIRAFKPDRIDRDLLVKILEPALHAPSWANTQPWEIVVAVGEPLERLRKAYGENLRNCVARNPDITMPREWPEACRMRMDMLKAERTAVLEQECKDPASIPDMMQMNYRLFNAPVVVYLCMDRCLTPWSLFDLGAAKPRHHARGRRARHRLGRGRHPRSPSRSDPQGTRHTRQPCDRHRHRTRLSRSRSSAEQVPEHEEKYGRCCSIQRFLI